jgi:hypothetical protein
MPVVEKPHTSPLEIVKDAIGATCGKYSALKGRYGGIGDGILCGTKRKICENNECATRRHKITVRADADRVGDWILSSEAEDLLPM